MSDNGPSCQLLKALEEAMKDNTGPLGGLSMRVEGGSAR
jgi:hypothetical protein